MLRLILLLSSLTGSRLLADGPNVVVLLADDLGWKDIGCYGGPVKTPTLDRLAASGARFTDFYSGAAVCSPSRATLLTGRSHLRSGIYSWISDWDQNAHLRLEEVTLAEILKDAGYQTVHLGKWHLGMPTPLKPHKPLPDQHGFDYWFATPNNTQPSHRNPDNFIRNGKRVGRIEGYACQIVVDEAIAWLDLERNPNKPFFLNVWFHEPHAPIAAPAPVVKRYGELSDPAAVYSGTIENTDRAVSRLLKKLSEVAPPEETLIIYASDNGSYRDDRVGHLRGTKGSNYEGGIRVPGIFSWPGQIKAGKVEATPAGLVDLLPTVCGLLKLQPPQRHLDGADLSPVLRGKQDNFARSQPLMWLLPPAAPVGAVRDGQHVLIAHRTYEFPRDQEKLADLKKQIERILREAGTYEEEIRGSTFQKQLFEGFKNPQAERLRGQFIRLNMFNENWIPAIQTGTYGRFELYDLSVDPSQTTNIASDNPALAAELTKRFLDFHSSVMEDAPDWQQTDKDE